MSKGDLSLSVAFIACCFGRDQGEPRPFAERKRIGSSKYKQLGERTKVRPQSLDFVCVQSVIQLVLMYLNNDFFREGNSKLAMKLR